MDGGQSERAPAGQLLSSASHWRRSPRSPPIEARASQRPINAPAADVPRDQHTIFIGRLGRFQPPPTPPSTPHPTHHLTPPHPSRTAHLHKYLVACSRKKKKRKKDSRIRRIRRKSIALDDFFFLESFEGSLRFETVAIIVVGVSSVAGVCIFWRGEL